MCNLLERFGKRFKIDFDPAYEPAHRPADKLDPWYMIIPCERGPIYPHGATTLTAEVEASLRMLHGLEQHGREHAKSSVLPNCLLARDCEQPCGRFRRTAMVI